MRNQIVVRANRCSHVEEFLAAGELWNDHKKVIFFPCSAATTCATGPLGVEKRYDAVFKASGIAVLGADGMQGIAAIWYDVIHARTG
ncbi:hypothetical protein Taro_048821 [Colocasia esculenta]|uniref:Uncharacterized protein n=1 Tax=Colocasia esculenta TaxID=4460 RepID=A0A843X954_COLES|nr:hypothetical protein [Colocasia esculenta]